MKFVFLMDPLETVHPDKDTTFALMLGADARGHEVYYLPKGGITRSGGKNFFHVTAVKPQRVAEQMFVRLGEELLAESDVDVCFIRTDPPFNDDYLFHTWLLDFSADRIVMINEPSGIRSVNEKLWATQFTELVPATMVTRQKSQMRSFLSDQKDIIVKPTDGFGGQGVMRVRIGDSNANVIFELLSLGYSREIILQEYVREAEHGDKRILLLDGAPLGAVLRLHSDEDHRNNFFSGGRAQPAEISPGDWRVISALKPHLQRLGLHFVGIDIMGTYLIEVNVTSPTCLQEMNHFSGLTLQDNVIRFAESRRLARGK
jgi:glutathione synthase